MDRRTGYEKPSIVVLGSVAELTQVPLPPGKALSPTSDGMLFVTGAPLNAAS
jgi:hypothetical protein